MSEEYVTIEAYVVTITDKSALVRYDDQEAWIPRSVMHYDTDAQLGPRKDMDLRIMEWKLMRLGWL